MCARELCCFAFQSLGVCAGATDGIATQAEVVDLLVCMAMAAANSTRHENVSQYYFSIFVDVILTKTDFRSIPYCLRSKQRQQDGFESSKEGFLHFEENLGFIPFSRRYDFSTGSKGYQIADGWH